MIVTKLAKFNGIAFNIVSSKVGGGYKHSEHEFNNAITGVQNHGAKNKTYSLSAIFVGHNALSDANRLISELDAAGAGILQHPYLGELDVAIESHSININTKHNQVIVDLTFIQRGEINLLSIDRQSLLAETITQTKTAVVNNIVSIINNSATPLNAVLEFRSINPNTTLSNLKQSLIAALDIAPVPTANTDPLVLYFNDQHAAINTADTNTSNRYKSTVEMTTAAQHINAIFESPSINAGKTANDFYNLKSVLSRQIIENNKDLPKIKHFIANTTLPSVMLKQRLGTPIDEYNNNIHPLFNDESVNYVG